MSSLTELQQIALQIERALLKCPSSQLDELLDALSRVNALQHEYSEALRSMGREDNR